MKKSNADFQSFFDGPKLSDADATLGEIDAALPIPRTPEDLRQRDATCYLAGVFATVHSLAARIDGLDITPFAQDIVAEAVNGSPSHTRQLSLFVAKRVVGNGTEGIHIGSTMILGRGK